MKNTTTYHKGKGAPFDRDNIDTDQIIPARFLKATERKDFDINFFRDWRFNQDGTPKSDFPLNAKEVICFLSSIIPNIPIVGVGKTGTSIPSTAD